MVPGIMAAPAAGGQRVGERDGIAGTVPRVFPNDTTFGMAFMVNHAPVLTPPLMALKTDGVPMKLSIDARRPVVVKGRDGSSQSAALLEPPTRWRAAGRGERGAVDRRGGRRVTGRCQRSTGVRTPAAVEAAW